VARYHATTATAELAYLCRAQPLVFTGKVEIAEKDDFSAMTSNDGPCLLVYTESRRVRVPLNDSYFADPIANLLGDDFHGAVELHGVLIGGRQRLRLRLPSLKKTEPLDVLSRVSSAKTTGSDGVGAGEEAGWVCGACTFENKNALGLACEVCQSERRPQPSTAASTATPEVVSLAPQQLEPAPPLPQIASPAAAMELAEVEEDDEEEETEEDEEILLQGVEEGEVTECLKSSAMMCTGLLYRSHRCLHSWAHSLIFFMQPFFPRCLRFRALCRGCKARSMPSAWAEAPSRRRS